VSKSVATTGGALSMVRIPELDGVRALAIWMVLVFHIFYGWVRVDHDFSPIPRAVMFAVGHGWLGVDLFFVLSGFLITGILLGSKSKPHYFRNFYVHRILRILPLYLVVLVTFFAFYSQFYGFLILSALFAANFAYAFNVAVPHGPAVLWSLAVEEHFYLFWPFLAYLMSRRALAAVAIAIVVLTPVARGLGLAAGMPIDDTVYVYSWFRSDGLALGALLAMWSRSARASPRNNCRLGGLLVAVIAIVTIAGIPFGVLRAKTVLATALRFTEAQFCFAALLLVVLAYQGSRLTAILRSPFLRLSGALSYCIYLIHFALGDAYQFLSGYFGLNPATVFGDLGGILMRGLFIVGTSFGIASLSRKYLEEPFLRRKASFPANSDAYSRKIVP
jgi:peptidoglycan/LPS O-acetylase OafA/YrhL